MERSKFEAEWCFLQNQFESYEKHSLYIKLFSILVLVVSVITNTVSCYIVLILGVLWGQDAIWKTFQSRIEPRLLQIEKAIAEQSNQAVFQFNLEYQKVSQSGAGLIKEYAKQAFRPTVAFPHVVLVFIMLAQCLWSTF